MSTISNYGNPVISPASSISAGANRLDESKTPTANHVGDVAKPKNFFKIYSSDLKSLKDRVGLLEKRCERLEKEKAQVESDKKKFREIQKEFSEATILFKESSAVPVDEDESLRKIIQMVQRLLERGDFQVIIQGHSNSHFWGGLEKDFKQSNNRAEWVRQKIINVSPRDKQEQIGHRLQIEKKGSLMPIENGKSPQNRRVTFVVHEYLEEYVLNDGERSDEEDGSYDAGVPLLKRRKAKQ